MEACKGEGGAITKRQALRVVRAVQTVTGVRPTLASYMGDRYGVVGHSVSEEVRSIINYLLFVEDLPADRVTEQKVDACRKRLWHRICSMSESENISWS